jgi:accessory colonization factor AcfC
MRDPRCLRITFGVFQAWKSKGHRNADVLCYFLADERTSADNQAISTTTYKEKETQSLLILSLQFDIGHLRYKPRGKVGAQLSQ